MGEVVKNEIDILLYNGIEKAVHERRLHDIIRCIGMFRGLGCVNQMLIGVQCPGATDIKGESSWLKVGRRVQNEAVGIRLVSPEYKIRYLKKNGVYLEKDELNGKEISEALRIGELTKDRIMSDYSEIEVYNVGETEGNDNSNDNSNDYKLKTYENEYIDVDDIAEALEMEISSKVEENGKTARLGLSDVDIVIEAVKLISENKEIKNNDVVSGIYSGDTSVEHIETIMRHISILVDKLLKSDSNKICEIDNAAKDRTYCKMLRAVEAFSISSKMGIGGSYR